MDPENEDLPADLRNRLRFPSVYPPAAGRRIKKQESSLSDDPRKTMAGII